MFGFFKKDPLKVLNDDYSNLLKQSRDLQRNGDIKGFAAMSAKAEEVAQKIDAMQQVNETGNDH